MMHQFFLVGTNNIGLQRYNPSRCVILYMVKL
jgi:hypothetical protein